MERALEAMRADHRVRERGFVTWETDNPPVVDSSTVTYSTLEALAKRGHLRREYLGTRRVSGQRISSRFGRSWRRGYTIRTVRYHLVD